MRQPISRATPRGISREIGFGSQAPWGFSRKSRQPGNATGDISRGIRLGLGCAARKFPGKCTGCASKFPGNFPGNSRETHFPQPGKFPGNLGIPRRMHFPRNYPGVSREMRFPAVGIHRGIPSETAVAVKKVGAWGGGPMVVFRHSGGSDISPGMENSRPIACCAWSMIPTESSMWRDIHRRCSTSQVYLLGLNTSYVYVIII